MLEMTETEREWKMERIQSQLSYCYEMCFECKFKFDSSGEMMSFGYWRGSIDGFLDLAFIFGDKEIVKLAEKYKQKVKMLFEKKLKERV